MNAVTILQERAYMLAAINTFLGKVHPPAIRKSVIMALREQCVICDDTTQLLIECHELESA